MFDEAIRFAQQVAESPLSVYMLVGAGVGYISHLLDALDARRESPPIERDAVLGGEV